MGLRVKKVIQEETLQCKSQKPDATHTKIANAGNPRVQLNVSRQGSGAGQHS